MRAAARWWLANRRALAFGCAAGLLWALLTTSSAAVRDPYVYDAAQRVVYERQAGAPPIAIPAEQFFAEFNRALLQLALLLFLVAGTAGWATWQVSIVRPRGDEQPRLLRGLDAYGLALAAGGPLWLAALHGLGAVDWLSRPGAGPLAVLGAALQVALPLYMGVALFLVWLLRLKSVRAPDWETHFPKPVKKTAGRPWLWGRRKGGDRQGKS